MSDHEIRQGFAVAHLFAGAGGGLLAYQETS